MPWRKKTTVKFWGAVVALCFLAALAALGLSRCTDAFYTNIPLGYEPKDSAREKALEQKPAGGTGR
jgi:hypothetical protein